MLEVKNRGLLWQVGLPEILSKQLSTVRPGMSIALLLFLLHSFRPDLLFADFEGHDYGAWNTTGQAFGPGPARGTLPNQMPVSGYRGAGLVNSFYGGDQSTGTLTSPSFQAERKYLNFLIGGGKHPGKTCMNLLLDGKVVRTATGPNDRPGGSEELDWQSWDLTELQGKQVVIQMVDQHTGGWGHITVDHIVQSDHKQEALLSNGQRDLEINKRYLLFPVKNHARKRIAAVLSNHETLRQFEIELADQLPDWWAFLDVSAWRGRRLTVSVNRLGKDSRGLEAVYQSDEIPAPEPLYHEKQRPQFHFSSKRGWNNDPNGLVYFQGEFHLFYQHNPYGWDWGNMHWGHAVSSDLVRWRELPIALYPHRFGDWVFSGSAIVDESNSSGFGKGQEPPLVAAFTSTGRGECLAYSTDRGRNWNEYEGNPVLKHQGRDPRLLWHGPTRRWVMAVYDESKPPHGINLYSSADLKNWRYESRIEGLFECPDLYELPVAGEPGITKWILSAASQEYYVGSFDGKLFRPESPKLRGHQGKGYYAAQTFSNMPEGRRVILFWLQSPTPGMPFNQAMSIPWEVSLQQTPEGLRLCYAPVRELETLHGRQFDLTQGAAQGELLDVEISLTPKPGTVTELTLRGVSIQYDADKRELRCQDSKAMVPLVAGKFKLRVLADRSSLEIVAGQGQVLMPVPILLTDHPREVRFRAGGEVEYARAFEMTSAWK
jgi:fructan beta-fructosidase